MRAVVVHEAGGPEVLRVEEVPDPRPAAGELLVRVEAIGINHVDLSRRAGGADTYPTILGYDAAGLREDTGEPVLVTSTPGTYVELVVAKAENVFAIPDSHSIAAAAALGVPYKTAWWALADMGGLKEGDALLVQGASTATGQAAVDIGRSIGAAVFATSRPEKRDQVRALGASHSPTVIRRCGSWKRMSSSIRSAPTPSQTASNRSHGREPWSHPERSATRPCPSTSGR